MSRVRPTSLKVGHTTYKIQWWSEKKWLKRDDPERSGSTWYGVAKIRLRLETSGHAIQEDALRETLLHEILHACWEQANLGGRGKIEDNELEELIVASLSFPLITVLQENPDVVEYLHAGMLGKHEGSH